MSRNIFTLLYERRNRGEEGKLKIGELPFVDKENGPEMCFICFSLLVPRTGVEPARSSVGLGTDKAALKTGRLTPAKA